MSPPLPEGTRLLRRPEVAKLLGLEECIDAVERAFRAHAAGRTIPPGVLSAAAEGGAFHVKTAGLAGVRPYFAAKVNGNFYGNSERFGLPRVQGLIVLADASNGYPLAVLDSIEITLRRTAAASTVAAKYLARADAAVATICGCGVQGRMHLAMLCRVRPIERAFAFDLSAPVAERFAEEMADQLGIEVVPTPDLVGSCRESQVCVTCTPSRVPLLGAGDLAPGTFLAAVGADSEEKQELAPELLQAAGVVVDHLEQCATIGELHHALDRGLLERSDVLAELHEVVSGAHPGRTSADEILIFDSTGVALEDVAAAALVFERAEAAGIGTLVGLLG
jgi:alanine dehydrogenase